MLLHKSTLKHTENHFFHRVNTIHLLLWWTIRAHVTTEKHFQKCTEIFSMRLNGSFSSCFALNDYLWTQLQITFCTFYTKKWNENNSTCFIFLFGEQTLNGFAPDKVFKLGKEIANFDCGFFAFWIFAAKLICVLSATKRWKLQANSWTNTQTLCNSFSQLNLQMKIFFLAF